MDPLRVGVVGARGRMGSMVCDTVCKDSECELVAELDLGDSLELLVQQRCNVVVDFTSPDVVMDNIAFYIRHSIPAVIGTSGITEERLENIQLWASQRNSSRIIIVPNFSVGAVLMTHFAALAAPYFESVEIIEMHHPDKIDAPSGTAIYAAGKISEARAGMPAIPDATLHDPGHARGSMESGITIHSVRLRGLVAHQEVLFGGAGETLFIRHDSLSRESFMPGVLLAIKEVGHLDGVTMGLEALLFPR